MMRTDSKKIQKDIKKIYSFIHGGLKMGSHFSDCLLIIYCLMRWKAISVIGNAFKIFPPVRSFSIRFNNRDVRIHATDDSSFSQIFYEIFISDDYRIKMMKDPKIIFDIGAHFGLATIYFSIKYPRSTIYSFEPCENSFKLLKLNTENLNNAKIQQMGMYSKDGFKTLYLGKNAGENSMIRTSGKTQIAKVSTIDSFCSSNKITNIDILKIDVEGSEMEILMNCKILSEVSYLVAEFHWNDINRNEMLALLANNFDVMFVTQDGNCEVVHAVSKNLTQKTA